MVRKVNFLMSSSLDKAYEDTIWSIQFQSNPLLEKSVEKFAISILLNNYLTNLLFSTIKSFSNF